MSEWFSVKVGLRQGCVMSPWLFNLFMDGVMKEFKANILNGGVKFGIGENAGKVSGLLFADDTTLMAESESNLQRYVRACKRRKLKISVRKSKVMKMSDTVFGSEFRFKW